MNKINFLIFSLILMLGTNLSANAKSKYIAKVGSVAPEGTPWAMWLGKVKKRMERDASGQLKMKVYLGSKLGGEREMIEETKRGKVHLIGVSVGALAAQYVPELNVFELPFLFDSTKEADYVMDKMRPSVAELLKKRGFILSMWSENGWHGIGTKKGCISNIKDFSGLRIRSQESNIHLNTYKAFGATPVELPVPEVLSSLELGTVDGFSTTPLFSFATGWYRPIKYFTYTKHMYQPALVVISKVWFDKLPKNVQKILTSNNEEAYGFKKIRALTNPLLNNFKQAGIKVCPIDQKQRKSLAKSAKTVWSKFAKSSPSSAKMLKEILRIKKTFKENKKA